MDLAVLYRVEFKQEFGHRVDEIQNQIAYASKNLLYTLRVYTEACPNYAPVALAIIIKGFLAEQIDGFEMDFDLQGWLDTEGYIIGDAGDPL